VSGIIINPYAFGGGGPTPDAYVTAVLAHSPLVYWRLGEPSGVTAVDASPNGRDGTYAGGPTLGATGLLHGSADTAVTLDGSDDFVSRSNEGWMDASGALTLIALVHPTDVTGRRTIASKWDDTSYPANAEWLFDHNGTTVRMLLQTPTDTGIASVASGVSSGATRFVAGRINGLTVSVRVYNASGLVGSGADTASGSVTSRTQPFRVGAEGAGAYYQGRIDEVAWIGSVLSDSTLDDLAGLALTGTPF